LAAKKELLSDAASDEKEKDFKNSIIEMLCGFDSGSIAAFMKILYNRNSSIKSFIFLFFLNLILLCWLYQAHISQITSQLNNYMDNFFNQNSDMHKAHNLAQTS
jgi:hypothetical protein